MTEPKVMILMFASGKLVCTGAKTEKEVYEAVYKLKRILETNEIRISKRELKVKGCEIVS